MVSNIPLLEIATGSSGKFSLHLRTFSSFLHKNLLNTTSWIKGKSIYLLMQIFRK